MKPSQAVREKFDTKDLKRVVDLDDDDDLFLVVQTRNKIIFYLEELELEQVENIENYCEGCSNFKAQCTCYKISKSNFLAG